MSKAVRDYLGVEVSTPAYTKDLEFADDDVLLDDFPAPMQVILNQITL